MIVIITVKIAAESEYQNKLRIKLTCIADDIVENYQFLELVLELFGCGGRQRFVVKPSKPIIGVSVVVDVQLERSRLERESNTD